MANDFLTPQLVAREAVMVLSDYLVMPNLVHRGHQVEFGGVAKAGDTVKIRVPYKPTVEEFTGTATPEDIDEGEVDFLVEKHFYTQIKVTSKEMTLSLQDFSEQIIRPTMVRMGETVEGYIHSKYVEIPYYVGTEGDPPDSKADITQVRKRQNELKAPLGMRFGVLDPTAEADFLNIDSVTDANRRGDDGTAMREASMGRFMGYDWFVSQAVKTHTAGTGAGIATPLIDGAGTAGDTTIGIDGGSASETLLVGDIIDISGEGEHVVTAANTASTGTFTAVAISPPLRANVADDTAVTIPDTHVANIAAHPNAITFAAVPLMLPMGGARGEYIQENGMGLRVVYGWDNGGLSDVITFDMLCGAKVRHQELALRVFG